jgi:limonene 1,2-monooxygenase
LAHHWNVMEERAAAHGTTVDRDRWSLVGLFHIAETEEQAFREVEHGLVGWSRYFAQVAAFPQMAVETGNVEEMIAFVNNSGMGVIGTPEHARAQVQRLWDQSKGFGSMLLMGHDWATPEATNRSAQLFAEEVFPYFQGQAQPTLDAAERAAAVREGHNQRQLAAIEHMTTKYQQESKSPQS